MKSAILAFCLAVALEAGSAVLAAGGSSLDAIQAAIALMEDDPLFNAGRGAVFTAAGRNELDAAVMDGSDLNAGAVAGLTTTRHPIAAVRAVMEQSPHVMLIGEGADTFAESVGLEQVDPAFFFTERRWRGLESALRNQNLPGRGRARHRCRHLCLQPRRLRGVGDGRWRVFHPRDRGPRYLRQNRRRIDQPDRCPGGS